MEGVEGLLESQRNGGLDAVSTVANNLPDLIHEIEEIKPGVVVIDEATSFLMPAELIASLLNFRYVRLIVLNSRTSKMDIYDKSEFMITHPSHFIEALNYRVPAS